MSDRLYWDEGNGQVTRDSSYAPIYPGSFYIETYEVRNQGCLDARIDIAYTQERKDNENMYYVRLSILNFHGLTYSDLGELVKLTIPEEKYDSLLKEWGVNEEETN